jgi:hypothetical protein
MLPPAFATAGLEWRAPNREGLGAGAEGIHDRGQIVQKAGMTEGRRIRPRAGRGGVLVAGGAAGIRGGALAAGGAAGIEGGATRWSLCGVRAMGTPQV